MTLNSLQAKSPQQIRAKKRRAAWEAEPDCEGLADGRRGC
jgi:hypothetical protein